ncbi:unnamed protein product [Diplocarpon coronariae]
MASCGAVLVLRSDLRAVHGGCGAGVRGSVADRRRPGGIHQPRTHPGELSVLAVRPDPEDQREEAEGRTQKTGQKASRAQIPDELGRGIGRERLATAASEKYISSDCPST